MDHAPVKKRRIACKELPEVEERKVVPVVLGEVGKASVIKAIVRRRRSGKLSMLPGLPLDILFEILAHLTPLDLLHLTRTTKIFRNTLLSRTSAYIWKAALADVPGLPECPEDMSEPAFVNLAFDHHCHICGKNGIRVVDWLLRIRYCPKCAKEAFSLNPPLRGGDKHKYLFTSSLPKYKWCYSAAQVRQLDMEFKAVEHDESALNALKMKKEKRISPSIENWASRCREWAESCTQDRHDLLRIAQKSRAAEISQRLKDLGWESELEEIPPTAFRNHPLVKPSVHLTDRIWMNIQAPLVQWMQEMRTLRLRCDRVKSAIGILRDYRATLADCQQQFLPGPADLCAFQEFKDVIDAPALESIPSTTFNQARDRLPKLVEEWRERVEMEIGELALGAAGWDDGERDAEARLKKLHLATTVFACDTCGRQDRFGENSLQYPWVLAHECLVQQRGMWRRDGHSPAYRDLSKEVACGRPDLEHKKWSCSKLKLDVDTGVNVIAPIIRCCGLDPQTTTTVELDELDPQLVCLTCTSERFGHSSYVLAHNWRSAADHASLHHTSSVVHWQRLTGELARTAKNQAIPQGSDMTDACRGLVEILGADFIDMIWSCSHCKYTTNEVRNSKSISIRLHLKERHSIENAVNADYYRDLRVAGRKFSAILPQGKSP